jgi:hypothetical protein
MVLKLSSLSGSFNDGFSIDIGSSGYTNTVLSNAYSSGGYVISSELADASMDIYFIAQDGSLAGYTSSKYILATKEFDTVVVFGATNNDLLSFEYKTTFSPSSSGNEVSAGPFITSVSISNLFSINDTTVVSGGNFANDIQAHFVGSDNVERSPKSIIRSSSSELIITRPDNFPTQYSPYSIKLVNPGINSPSGTNANILSNSISAGSSPTWSTTTTDSIIYNVPYSFFLSATDPDNGQLVYTIVSGSLPTGITLNENTGAISGTASVNSGYGSFNITFRATDPGGNFLDKQLSFGYFESYASGGTVTTSGGYRIHTFNSSETFTMNVSRNVEYLVVAGGGGGSASLGGAGGAGGMITGSTTLNSNNYTITIGGGGATSGFGISGVNGSNSSAITLTAIGGGGGAGSYQGAPSVNANGGPAGSGGSGGGGGARWGPAGSTGTSAGGAGTSGQGNAGGAGYPTNSDYSYQGLTAGGGGGAGTAGSNGGFGPGGNGGVGLQWPTGSGTFYAGGGGGRGQSANGTGGNGGGGNPDVNGTANRGGGGGSSASGGSGIVVIRYLI